MGIQPIKKINISEEIANQIQKLITEGYFKPGEKLPSERELCDEIGVSRTSIREALKGLVLSGFLEKRSDGTYVREKLTDIVIRPMNLLLSSRELSMDEIFEARLVLESQNARLAALKSTKEDMELLEKCILKMEDPKASPEAIMDCSVEFHSLIAKATKNKILCDVFNVIYEILNNMRKEPGSIKQIQKSTAFHRDVFDRIKNRDMLGAEKAMRVHISSLQKAIK